MKKIVCFALVLVLAMGGVMPKAKAKTVNGMVFVYFDYPAVVYQILSKITSPYTLELWNPKWAGLTNTGTIKEVHIRIPLEESYVVIDYPNINGFVYTIRLKFYKIEDHYLLFIFNQ